MFFRILAATALLVGSQAPAFAQSQSMQPEHAQADAMHSGPTARQMNRASLRSSQARAMEREQNRRDRRAYMAAVRAHHHRAVSRYDRRYARQQMAYANAMAAWRRQVSACHHGNHRACRARAPRVADFY